MICKMGITISPYRKGAKMHLLLFVKHSVLMNTWIDLAGNASGCLQSQWTRVRRKEGVELCSDSPGFTETVEKVV